MTADNQDPVRLADDPTDDSPLANLVRAGREDVGTEREIRELHARLAPLLWPVGPGGAGPGGDGGAAPPPGAGAAGAAGAGGGALALGKWAALTGALVAAGGTLYLAADHDAPAHRPEAVHAAAEPGEKPQDGREASQAQEQARRASSEAEPSESESPPNAEGAAVPPAEGANPSTSEPSSAATAAPTPRATPKRSSRTGENPSKPEASKVTTRRAETEKPSPEAPSAEKEGPATDPLATEAGLLEAARRALGGNPGRALVLAQEHQRRFPSGILVQEREVLAIEALGRLGQTQAARRRAEAFKKRFPHSAHARKIDGVLR